MLAACDNFRSGAVE